MHNEKKSRQTTQSTSNVVQTDARVAAADSGIALGSGAALDQSSFFHDESQTTLNTTDARDLSQHFTDQSTNYSLDAEFGVAALNRTADVLETQIEEASGLSAKVADTLSESFAAGLASNNEAATIASDLIEKTTAGAFGVVETALERSLDDAAAARDQQAGFLSEFYRDREDNDAKATGDFIKYGSAVAALGLIAFAIRSKGR